MKINPPGDSPGNPVLDTLKDATYFPALAKLLRQIINAFAKTIQTMPIVKNIESECEENGECIKGMRVETSESALMENARLAVTHCLDADDCQHPQDNECSDGVCSQKKTSAAVPSAAIKRWHTCKQYSVTTTKYCACKFSTGPACVPNCPKTP